jgi:hypothetical protein
MNVLPVVGLVAGFAIGDRRAFVVTLLAAGIGLTLVAIFTDEIDGWGDGYVWALLVVSMLATLLGIGGRRWLRSRQARRRAV